MPPNNRIKHSHPRNSIKQRPAPHFGNATAQPIRPRDWVGLSAQEVLAKYPIGRSNPLAVLEVLLKLFNHEHTTFMKSVSHKTRAERAAFLRRFFRDLRARAGFKTLPDPRNLGQKHIAAIVKVWQEDGLQAPTIQTYLSFLRGLARWLGKNGFVRQPTFYGLKPDEYQRTGIADRDKSWSAQQVDIDALLEKVSAYDAHVGGCLRLIRAFGLRRKESIMLRPNSCVMSFEATGLPLSDKRAENYVWVRQGAKNGRQRFLPLDTPQRIAALAYAQATTAALGSDAPMGSPSRDLRGNLRHFDYVVRKFGISAGGLGITAHGLRHEALIDEYVALTGQQPPVRGGEAADPQAEADARKAVARFAGHERTRASSAYLGSARKRLPAADRQESPIYSP